MYTRSLSITDPEASFFLFGPRGTGKTTWLKQKFPGALYLDLLDSVLQRELYSHPENLRQLVQASPSEWVIIDEVQKAPELLNEVHRLIEESGQKFILTGSSARKLRKQGVNLLAGRARTHHFFPLTAGELGGDFALAQVLSYGSLPIIHHQKMDSAKAEAYLSAYVATYLQEEVYQESLTRSLANFSRFLESASLSQGSILNASNLARDSGVERKTVQNYFTILKDLRIAFTLPFFRTKAKRDRLHHEKLYFFDTGVCRVLRPKGFVDNRDEWEGIAMESLCFQELLALNEYLGWGYALSYWRTRAGLEVDFVLHGAMGLYAIEVKRSGNLNPKDLHGLLAFKKTYPEAKCILLYGGERRRSIKDIEIIPFEEGLKDFAKKLAGPNS